MSGQGTYASPPCMAAEVDPTYFDPLGTDAQQARDVARWRRAERTRLADLREGLGQTGRAQAAARLTTIYPQPHDIPLDRIVTETGVSGERKDPS
ncbi:hypothetical protein RPE78_18610 (plasmid) [Thioclava litoralis]|uniref:Uncharacterized protein n=1 Tax=Thioclava litoralis TaxID=3076557 RepID=A0ABZ1E4R0_9RHOB|nr:hypothetical protein RPE78_18610 [Thioclava sp. FTW29]